MATPEEKERLASLLTAHNQGLAVDRHAPTEAVVAAFAPHVVSPWRLAIGELRLGPTPQDVFMVRAISEGDDASLAAFGLHGLSAESRDKFGPYEWAAPPEALREQLRGAIAAHRAKRDLHFLAESRVTGQVVAHAFLWSANEPIPELGVAVADAWHRRGLGRALLLLLEAAARGQGKEALELTTMQTNAPALAAYLKAGYEQLGIIRNPVGVDVPAAFRGEVVATRFCDEHQLVRVLDESKRAPLLAALGEKRVRAEKLFGSADAPAAP